MRPSTKNATFLFTDIEGSTALLLQGEAAYVRVLTDHRRVLREAFARHGGEEVDTQGDAFFVAFAHADDAVAAAAEAQRGLAVPVRMGIHTGEAIAYDEGYIGESVHRAARIAHAAHGGQILVSEVTRGLLTHEPVELRDLGEHRLKDLTSAQRLFQVGTKDFPPLRTLDISRTNLPPQPTRFLGRERELEEVVSLLREEDVRLLTLTGPGGSGKTRIALQAAADIVDDFAAGAWFAGLADQRNGEEMRGRIAASLGLTAPEQLGVYLAKRELLLLLDNLEQIPDAGHVVARLVRESPGVRVLATSRERLNVAAEQEYQIPPLSDPDAVEMFSRRARAVKPSFRLEEHRAAVEEICRQVDALPLAIELAAARTKILQPSVLSQRLERALPLLKSTLTDIPERHRTLAATIAWSYDLLAPEEQEVFRRLSVFAGTFSVEAAAAVSASRLDSLETLAGLVDKSLVVPVEGGQEARFRLLRTIGEFSQDRLQTEDDEAETWRQLAQYLGGRALEVDARHGLGSGDARLEQQPDYPNLIAAVRWTFAHDRQALARLLANAWQDAKGAVPRDELEWLAMSALEEIDEIDAIARVNLLAIVTSTRRRRGDLEGAIAAADERIRILGEVADPERLGFARNERGAFALLQRDFERAEREFESAEQLLRGTGNDQMADVARSNIVELVAARDGDFVRALQLFEELDPTSEGVACMAICLGDLERGAAVAEQAYHHYQRRDNSELTAYCLDLLSVVAQRQNDARLAARLMGASDQLLQDQGTVLTYRSPYEDELFAEARARVRDVLGVSDFARLAAEGAELVRASRTDELVAGRASEPRDKEALASRS